MFKKKKEKKVRLDSLYTSKKDDSPFPPCIAFLTQLCIDQGAQETEGIFRIAISKTVRDKLLKEFLATKKIKEISPKNAHAPACVLKSLLDLFDPPVFPDYRKVLASKSLTPEALQSLADSLPPIHLSLISHLSL